MNESIGNRLQYGYEGAPHIQLHGPGYLTALYAGQTKNVQETYQLAWHAHNQIGL